MSNHTVDMTDASLGSHKEKDAIERISSQSAPHQSHRPGSSPSHHSQNLSSHNPNFKHVLSTPNAPRRCCAEWKMGKEVLFWVVYILYHCFNTQTPPPPPPKPKLTCMQDSDFLLNPSHLKTSPETSDSSVSVRRTGRRTTVSDTGSQR